MPGTSHTHSECTAVDVKVSTSLEPVSATLMYLKSAYCQGFC